VFCFRLCLAIAALQLLSVGRVAADQTTPADRAVQDFRAKQVVNVAVRVRRHELEQSLTQRIATYHPMSTKAINRTKSLAVLRTQLIEAQNALDSLKELVARNDPNNDDQDQFLNKVTDAVWSALKASPFATVSIPISPTRTLSVHDAALGFAPTVGQGFTTTCNVLAYVNGAFGTGGPQFVSSTGQSVGQKNTLSIIGFGLGAVPIVLNCTKDKSSSSNPGK